MTSLVVVVALIIAATTSHAYPLEKENWKFKVVDGQLTGVTGRLEMIPATGADWGGICRTGIGENEARAICRTLGVPIPPGKDVGYFPAFLSENASMWLSNVSCPPGDNFLENCTFTYSESGHACSPDDNLGIDCITGTASPTFAPSYTFVATFRPTTMSYTIPGFNLTFVQALGQYYGISAGRIWIQFINETWISDQQQFAIQFQFRDTYDSNAITKYDLEVLLPRDQWAIFGTDMGFVSLISNMPATPAPVYLNMSDWQFRLVDGPAIWVGRLEVKAGANADWGTVCGAGFGIGAAFAACGSLGFSTPSASPLKFFSPSGTGLIALSNIVCNLGQQSLQLCSMTVSTPQNAQSNCIHAEDVGVDCFFNVTPPATLFTDIPGTMNPAHNAPVLFWTATIYTVQWHEGFFKGGLQSMIGIAANRVVIESVRVDPVDDQWTYVTFYFLDGEPPRLTYDYELNSVDSEGLQWMAGIYGLSNNATSSHLTEAPGSDYSIHWTTQLSEGFRGLVSVTPWITNTTTGAVTQGFDWGTVCPWGYAQGDPNPFDTFFFREAAAACKSAGYPVSGEYGDSSTSAIIPYFAKNLGGNLLGKNGPIYLSQVRCDPNKTLDGCELDISMPGAKNNSCSHTTDVGVLCIQQLASPPPNPNANVTTYHVTVPVDMANQHDMWMMTSFYIPVNIDRFKVTDIYYETNGQFAVVDFFFMDVLPNTTGVSRQDLDYWFQHISSVGLQKMFGITQVLTTFGAPAWIPTMPPNQYVNQDGWQWRITGDGEAPTVGLLEVKRPGFEWGTVCGNWFTAFEAIAACNSVNIPTTFAVARVNHPDHGTTQPIAISNVFCQTINGPDPTLKNCSMHLFADDPYDCTHLDDVVLDCKPNGVEQEPLEFIAVVKTLNYTEQVFKDRFAYFYTMNATRVLISNTWTFETFTFVNFTFSQGPPENVTLPIEQPPADGESNGGEPPTGSEFPGLEEEPHEVGNSDKTILDRMTFGLDPTVLFVRFGIYELRANASSLKAPLSQDKSTWQFQLINAGNRTEATWYGRLQVQPGTNAPWGSICGSSLGGDALPYEPFAANMNTAVNLCRMFRPDTNYALLVPNYVRYGNGVIYLSAVNCPQPVGAPLANGNVSRDYFLSSCQYTISEKTTKRNNCTHNDDVGLICGQDVTNYVERAPTGKSTLFHGSFVTNFDLEQFRAKLASVAGIDVRRINASWPLFDEEDQITRVNFTFYEFEDVLEATGAAFTVATLDLFMQSFNLWGLFTHFNMTTLQWTYIPKLTLQPQTLQPTSVPQPTEVCTYSAWAAWSDCSLPCVGGEMIRTRTIVSNNAGTPCPGPLFESQSCNANVQCSCGLFSSLACPAALNCTIISGFCIPLSAVTPQPPGPTEACDYTPWSNWGSCSQPCNNGGMQTRTRGILKNNAGMPCPGPLQQSQACNTAIVCSCDFFSSTSCPTNIGCQLRGNTCVNASLPTTAPPPTTSAAPTTAAPILITTTSPATTASPALSCTYSAWSAWSACSLPCVGGSQMQTRTVLSNPTGAPCAGPLQQEQPCNAAVVCQCTLFTAVNCPWQLNCTVVQGSCVKSTTPITPPPSTTAAPPNAACIYTNWSAWSACSLPCDGGMQYRTRTVLKDAGPVPCPGPFQENAPCNQNIVCTCNLFISLNCPTTLNCQVIDGKCSVAPLVPTTTTMITTPSPSSVGSNAPPTTTTTSASTTTMAPPVVTGSSSPISTSTSMPTTVGPTSPVQTGTSTTLAPSTTTTSPSTTTVASSTTMQPAATTITTTAAPPTPIPPTPIPATPTSVNLVVDKSNTKTDAQIVAELAQALNVSANDVQLIGQETNADGTRTVVVEFKDKKEVANAVDLPPAVRQSLGVSAITRGAASDTGTGNGDNSSGPPIAVIAGAAAGAVVLIAVIVGVVVYTQSKKKESRYDDAYVSMLQHSTSGGGIQNGTSTASFRPEEDPSHEMPERGGYVSPPQGSPTHEKV